MFHFRISHAKRQGDATTWPSDGLAPAWRDARSRRRLAVFFVTDGSRLAIVHRPRCAGLAKAGDRKPANCLRVSPSLTRSPPRGAGGRLHSTRRGAPPSRRPGRVGTLHARGAEAVASRMIIFTR